MKIVHIVRQFHPAVGGLESVVQELAKWQVAHGDAVRIVTLDRIFNAPQDHLPTHENIGGAEVIRIPFFGSTRYPIATSVIRHITDADVVHVHAIDFFFDYLAWTKPIHRKPLVASTHGGFFHTPYARVLKRLYFSTITRASLTWYEGIAAVSRSDHDQFKTQRHQGLVCIENGTDTSKYREASSPTPMKSIISVGRLSKNKRLDRLVAFLHALRQRDPEWRLTIAGRPWDVDVAELTALARRLQVEKALEIKVLPTNDEIRTAIGSCSFVASASEYEGFGLTAVEGLSAGLLPVLSDIPPFRSVVERTGIGLLLDFAKPEAAAEQLVASWPEIIARFPEQRRSAISAAGQFDWRRVCDAYAELYEFAIGTKVRTILGVPITVDTVAEAVEQLDSRFQRGEPAAVAFANAHALNLAATNPEFRGLLRRCIVFNDGFGADIASRVLYGRRFPDNLNGTDFTPLYLGQTRHRFRIFLLGGKPGVAKQAAMRLSQLYPHHRIVGWSSGYFPAEDSQTIVEVIRARKADIVLVAMGNPRQELWLDQHLAATSCRLGFAVGALFDFLAGEVPRAAPWIRAARLEWAHRMICEPRRLWSRYILGNPVFLLRVAAQWSSGSRVPS
jgi:alpha-1,3-mannosyltransferase